MQSVKIVSCVLFAENLADVVTPCFISFLVPQFLRTLYCHGAKKNILSWQQTICGLFSIHLK